MIQPRPHPSEIVDAKRFVDDDAVEGFVRRQRRARLRVALMQTFYGRYRARVSALHELAACAIAVARFAALSEAYDEIGDRLLPVDEHGQPRTPLWAAYVRTFEEGQPADVREEHWIAAHVADMEAVKALGWVERFDAERRANEGDPTWDLLAEHMAVSLGTRVEDGAALAGSVALETAIATSLGAVVRRQLRTGMRLCRTYVFAAARAVLHGGPHVAPHVPSDRRLVWAMCGSALRLVSLLRVYRLGLHRRDRGTAGQGAAWSLRPNLDAVLGDGMQAVHPLVLRMFDTMGDFRMTASVHLYHRMGSWMAWLATLLVGQGMYEQHLDEVPARFQLFRRDDGSLHFVREFWCDDATRVFDSDFVLRDVDGKPTILEIFTDLGIAACMRTEVLPDGGVSMTVRRLFVRGIPTGVGPFLVRFETRPDGPDRLLVTGVLEVHTESRLGRRFWHRVAGLPEKLGEIRYYARPEAVSAPDEASASGNA